MGSILDISCRECRYNNEYFLGVGEFFSERNNKSILIVNKIAGIDKHRIIIEDSFVQVFRCFGCNGLFNKMQISYKVKDSLRLSYNVLYECNKCREPLYPLFCGGLQCYRQINFNKTQRVENIRNDYELYYYEKVIQDIPCHKCGNRKLYLNGWGVFE
jgi:hypothetical protein